MFAAGLNLALDVLAERPFVYPVLMLRNKRKICLGIKERHVWEQKKDMHRNKRKI